MPSFSLYVSLEDVKDREALIEELSALIGIDPELVRKNWQCAEQSSCHAKSKTG